MYSSNQGMSDKTFQSFKVFIESHIGIKIVDVKKVMIESRLMPRLKALEINNFKEYEEYFFSPEGQLVELSHFVDMVTTNKTDFFRENDHFKFLEENILPSFSKIATKETIRFWSAAASIGEEAYTIAMILENYRQKDNYIKYKVLATDISEKVLKKGRDGIYPFEDSNPIPLEYKKKYCLKSKDGKTIKICSLLKNKVSFKNLNLTQDSYRLNKKYHVIFLRNVLIYFDHETQTKIISNMIKHLHNDGYLILGMSENVVDKSLPIKRVGASIYTKT